MRLAVRLKHLAPALIWAGLSSFALAQTAPEPGPEPGAVSEGDSRSGLPAPAVDAATPPAAVPPVEIETSPDLPHAVLVLDVDQAYETSAWGRRAKVDIETAAREIEAENKRLEAQLTAEEQALTAERATLAPDAFRKKAEEFDARAQRIRRERADAVRDLGSRAEADRNAFLNAALPVVTTLMQERQAAVVLDRRQALLAVTAVDITVQLVDRMDDTVGAGSALPGPGTTAPEDAAASTQTTPPAQAPERPPAETPAPQDAPAQ